MCSLTLCALHLRHLPTGMSRKTWEAAWLPHGHVSHPRGTARFQGPRVSCRELRAYSAEVCRERAPLAAEPWVSVLNEARARGGRSGAEPRRPVRERVGQHLLRMHRAPVGSAQSEAGTVRSAPSRSVSLQLALCSLSVTVYAPCGASTAVCSVPSRRLFLLPETSFFVF